MAAEAGFDAIDYSYICNKESEEVLCADYINYAKNLRAHLDKAGITCNKAHAPFTFEFGTPKELNTIVEKIKSPWIVSCVDIGHASLTGYEPEEFINGLTPGILKCLHVQDNDYLDDRHIVPYMGNLNWEAIMTSLKKTGYTCDLTFEIIYFLGKLNNGVVW